MLIIKALNFVSIDSLCPGNLNRRAAARRGNKSNFTNKYFSLLHYIISVSASVRRFLIATSPHSYCKSYFRDNKQTPFEVASNKPCNTSATRRQDECAINTHMGRFGKSHSSVAFYVKLPGFIQVFKIKDFFRPQDLCNIVS